MMNFDWLLRNMMIRRSSLRAISIKELIQATARRLNGVYFLRQQVVVGYITGCHCHSPRLVVEADGAIHDQSNECDVERDEFTAQLGL